MFIFVFLLLATLFLAYTNGANDNFKGVATLWGSKTTNYKKAITYATVTTFAGSLAAIFLAGKLISSFSGKGLIPDSIISKPEFLIAVALGAALTVLIATLIGIPISTTHSITGALVGGGLIATGFTINLSALGNNFFLPLMLSPLIAVFLTVLIYPVFRTLRIKFGITKKMCVCIDGRSEEVIMQPQNGAVILKSSGIALTVDKMKNCVESYSGMLWGFDSQKILDKLHYISAGMVSFARGLNDTPKIVALLIGVKILHISHGLLLVGIAIAIGGLLNAKKVATTMSHRITGMNHGQGFTSNLITAFLVIFASKLGMPVSTTHLSCGSLFGLGLVNKKAHWNVIFNILLSWIITLPLAALLSGIIYWILLKL